jgi:DNA-binding CsgD family transcriptional regulator
LHLRTLVTQARSLYACGDTRKAWDVIADVDWSILDSYARLNALLLLLDVSVDLLCLDESTERDLRLRAEQWRDRFAVDSEIAEIGLAWVAARAAHYRGDRTSFVANSDAALSSLRPLAYGREREALKAFCRFATDAACGWADFGDFAKAGELLREIMSVLNSRTDLPPSLLAEVHAALARIYASDVATFPLWQASRDEAGGLANKHGFLRTAWLCQYLDAAVALGRTRTTQSDDGIGALANSVEMSSSAVWTRVVSELVAKPRVRGKTSDAAPFEIRRYRVIFKNVRQAAGVRSQTSLSLRTPLALTPRQSEIAELAARGASDRDIAAQLGISHRTVANHLATVLDQLGIRSRRQLAGRLDAKA